MFNEIPICVWTEWWRHPHACGLPRFWRDYAMRWKWYAANTAIITKALSRRFHDRHNQAEAKTEIIFGDLASHLQISQQFEELARLTDYMTPKKDVTNVHSYTDTQKALKTLRTRILDSKLPKKWMIIWKQNYTDVSTKSVEVREQQDCRWSCKEQCGVSIHWTRSVVLQKIT